MKIIHIEASQALQGFFEHMQTFFVVIYHYSLRYKHSPAAILLTTLDILPLNKQVE